MLIRLLIYGTLGWICEILWTGFGALLRGNWQLPGFTYLWMFFIYGFAALLFEPLHRLIKNLPIIVRGLIWMTAIFIVEYLTGWFLDGLLGRCPWDYSSSTPYHLNGYIRFDYAPVWFMLGLFFEKGHQLVDTILDNILHWSRKQDII